MKFLIQIPQLIYGGAEKVLVNFANVKNTLKDTMLL